MKPLHAMAPAPVLPAAPPSFRVTGSPPPGATSASAAAILAATSGRLGAAPNPMPKQQRLRKPAAAEAATKPATRRQDSRRAEIEAAWISEARRVLDLDASEPPLRHQWLLDQGNGDPDTRILAELGRWVVQLGAVHCRRAAGVASRRHDETKNRKDSRRMIERGLRELRLFMTARQRQLKRRRRDSLALQLAVVVDRYRAMHPERSPDDIRASVRELLAGLTEGRRTIAV